MPPMNCNCCNLIISRRPISRNRTAEAVTYNGIGPMTWDELGRMFGSSRYMVINRYRKGVCLQKSKQEVMDEANEARRHPKAPKQLSGRSLGVQFAMLRFTS